MPPSPKNLLRAFVSIRFAFIPLPLRSGGRTGWGMLLSLPLAEMLCIATEGTTEMLKSYIAEACSHFAPPIQQQQEFFILQQQQQQQD